MVHAHTAAGAAFYRDIGYAMRDALRDGAGWEELTSALRKRTDEVGRKVRDGIDPADYNATKDIWK